MTTGSLCEKTYHLSDAEGRKHAACEKEGREGIEKRKITLQGQTFQGKPKNKLIISKHNSTQFTVPLITQSFLEDGEKTIMKALGIWTALQGQITGLFVRKVFK